MSWIYRMNGPCCPVPEEQNSSNESEKSSGYDFETNTLPLVSMNFQFRDANNSFRSINAKYNSGNYVVSGLPDIPINENGWIKISFANLGINGIDLERYNIGGNLYDKENNLICTLESYTVEDNILNFKFSTFTSSKTLGKIVFEVTDTTNNQVKRTANVIFS